MSTQHLSEQEHIRREKLEGLRKLGIDPYPAPLYPVNSNAAFIKANYKGEENKAKVNMEDDKDKRIFILL